MSARDRTPRCPDCAYDLTGAAIDRCPECGVDVDPRDPRLWRAGPGRLVSGVHLVLILSVWMPQVLVLLAAWNAAAQLGHWPRAWFDDPKTLEWDAGAAALTWLVLLSPGVLLGSILLILIGVAVSPRHRRWRWVAWRALLTVGMIGLAVLVFWLDPGRAWAWVID